MSLPRLIQASKLQSIGLNSRELAVRSNKGELIRVRRGIYVESAPWQALSLGQKYGLRAAAFGHLAGTEPVFSHQSAALLWGLWMVGTPTKLHVLTETTVGGRSRKDVSRHVGSLTKDVLRCGQFLVTDKLTTTMALINKLSFPYAVAVCDSSLRTPKPRPTDNIFLSLSADPQRLGDATWEHELTQGPPLLLSELRAAALELPSAAARARAQAVIDFSSADSGSAGESISRAKMHLLGFPAPQLQRRFVLRDGSNAFVDFWFEEYKVAGEFDGRGKYLRAGWGGGKSIQDRVLAEKAREDQIRAQGVGFVRWTWDEMQNRERFAWLLRQAGLPQR